MFITDIKIFGFKSFGRETYLTNLSPRINAIVGQNGAGKSNVLQAISLVLGADPVRLAQLIPMMTEKRGPKSAHPDAWIELTLDNSDKTLPHYTDVVILKRLISHRHTKLLANGEELQPVEEAQLKFYLQPILSYVKQGEIVLMATISDSFRLNHMMEAIGQTGYQQLRNEMTDSLKLLEDNMKLLADKVAILESQKNHYEKQSRASVENSKREKVINFISFTIKSRELQRLLDNEEAASQKTRAISDEIVELHDKVVKANNELLKVSLELQTEKQENVKSVSTRDRFVRDLEEMGRLTAQLKNEVKGLEERSIELNIVVTGTQRTNRDAETRELEAQIQANTELIKELEQKAQNVTEQIGGKQLEIRILKEKMAREVSNSYKDLKKKELIELKNKLRNISEPEEERKLVQESKKLKAEHDRLISERGLCRKRLGELQSEIQTLKREIAKGKFDQEELRLKQRKIWDDKDRKLAEITNKREGIMQKEVTIKESSKHMRKVYDSIQQVQKIVEKFRNSASDADKLVAMNYCGLLLENYTVKEEGTHTAVEVAGGMKLFYHIVKTRDTAVRILAEFNAQKCAGEVYFLVEEVLKQPPPLPKQAIIIQKSKPLTECIEPLDTAPSAVTNSITHTFGRFVLCSNLLVVSSLKKHKVNCVTIEGDVVTVSGPMTGGYRDPQKSVPKAYLERRALLESVDVLTKELVDIDKNEKSLSNKIGTKKKKVEELELDLDKHILDVEQEEFELEKSSFSIAVSEKTLKNSLISIENLKQQKNLLKTEINARQADMNSGFQAPRNAINLLKQLEEELEGLQTDAVFAELADTKRETAKNEYKLNVFNKIQHLDASTSEVFDVHQLQSDLDSNDDLLRASREKLEKANRSWEVLKQTTEKIGARLVKNTEKVKRMQAKIAELDLIITETNGKLASNRSKLNRLCAKYESGKAKLRMELDAAQGLPMEHCPETQQLNTKQLLEKLRALLKKQAGVQPVSIKAAELANGLEVQITQYQQDIQDTKNCVTKIEKFLKDLDSAGDKTTLKRLRDIQLALSKVYKKLTKSELHRQRDLHLLLYGDTEKVDDQLLEFRDTDSPETVNEDIIHKFKGASFEMVRPHQDEEGPHQDLLKTSSLSGGQKTILAFSYYMASLDLTPGKIYLFDELDQALDKKYRVEVMKHLKELAEKRNAQIFLISFTSELVSQADKIFEVQHRNVSKFREVSDYKDLEYLTSSDYESSVSTLRIGADVHPTSSSSGGEEPMEVETDENSD